MSRVMRVGLSVFMIGCGAPEPDVLPKTEPAAEAPNEALSPDRTSAHATASVSKSEQDSVPKPARVSKRLRSDGTLGQDLSPTPSRPPAPKPRGITREDMARRRRVNPRPGRIIANSIEMRLITIAPGHFMMGTDEGGLPQEKPSRPIRITGAFYIGRHEVTQEQFQRVMGHNPSRYAPSGDFNDRVDGLTTDRHPVDNTTFDDALAFCEALSNLPEEAGRHYRLPTSAEWEYVCRAGGEGRFCFGDDQNRLGQYAWYEDNSEKHPWPVGKKRPNAFGVLDMHGNVQEWCTTRRDLYKSTDVADDPADPFGSIPQADLKVRRGGNATRPADACRVTALVNYGRSYEVTSGFRVVMLETVDTP